MYLQKSGLSAKLNFCTFLVARTIFYLHKKCKLANKKMVLLRWCKAESFGFLIRHYRQAAKR